MTISIVDIIAFLKELISNPEKMEKFKEIVDDLKELINDIKDAVKLIKE